MAHVGCLPNFQPKLDAGRARLLIEEITRTGITDRKKGSGRPNSTRTEENVSAVEELILSQEDKPQTHSTTRQITRLTGISQSSMVRIIHKDLSPKCLKKRRAQELTDANRLQRLTRAKQLLSRTRLMTWTLRGLRMRRCLRWPHQRIHRMIAFTRQLE
jgi:hypothetical protein